MNKEKEILILLIPVIFLTLGVFYQSNIENMDYVSISSLPQLCYTISACTLVLAIIFIVIKNKFYRGFRYGITYYLTMSSLEKQLNNAGVYDNKENKASLPRIELEFSKDLSEGILKIENSIYLDERLNNILLSAGLSNYIVEQHYKTMNESEYIYELIDSSITYRPVYNNFEDFLYHNKNCGKYCLIFDNRFDNVPLHHTLLTGQTGSGKSYFLYGIILQMLNKDIDYNIYFCDPKMSGLSVIGNKVSPNKTAVSFDEIVLLLEKFVAEIDERKIKMENLLCRKLDSDYKDFDIEPMIFMIDEFASFSYSLENKDKKTRDKVNDLIAKIILEGRQLGAFFWAVMQKSDSKLISTAFRENMPVKVVLGNSEKQTYVTTFGQGIDVPNKKFDIGEGVFISPQVARIPKILFTPFYNFEILKYMTKAPDM
ncbi:FtsK/SpoIIIE domain-containing protein [Peptostreptococcus faecalis]|uniref:FtsK/SpoIIIE domain-containing protein n=1 Tax=Peptostreptococcus faecalis TaxID=2045015 RepID=UPI000C7B919D|nr:FtsK/SpoIIIE domain-containing protein [Peptostreptococcus faecalis]